MGVPRMVTVGTTPLLVLPYNPNRTGLRIVYLPSQAVPANVSVLYVGIGIPPDPTLGSPLQFDPITPGGEHHNFEAFPGDPSVPEESVWLAAAGAGQVVQVEEDAFSPDEPERSVPVFVTGQGPSAAARIPPRPVPTPLIERGPREQVPYAGKIPEAVPVGVAYTAGATPTPVGPTPPPPPPPPPPSGGQQPGSPGPYAQKV